jgi:hypothetical protein
LTLVPGLGETIKKAKKEDYSKKKPYSENEKWKLRHQFFFLRRKGQEEAEAIRF